MTDRDFEFLKSFVDRLPKEIFDDVMKRMEIVDYEDKLQILKQISDTYRTPEYLFWVNHYSNADIKYLPRYEFSSKNGDSLSPDAIARVFMKEPCEVDNLMRRVEGGKFCKRVTEMEDDVVMGAGRYGIVFAMGDKVIKMNYSDTHKSICTPTIDGEFVEYGDVETEVVTTALITSLAAKENNPHMVEMISCDVCKTEDRRFTFISLKRIDGVLANIESGTFSDQQLLSLLFQHIRALVMLRNHAIVHNDCHSGNLAFVKTDAQAIDYDDGWSVPTHGLIGKLIDFGVSSRFIHPIFLSLEKEINRALSADLAPIHAANMCGDIIMIIFSYLYHVNEIEKQDVPETKAALNRAVTFFEQLFGEKWDNIHQHGVTVFFSNDWNLIEKFMDSVFPQFRKA